MKLVVRFALLLLVLLLPAPALAQDPGMARSSSPAAREFYRPRRARQQPALRSGFAAAPTSR